MRFLFVSTMDEGPWGGSEELWSRAALRLRQQGHAVRASVADWPQKSRQLQPLLRHGVELEYHLPRFPGLRSRLWNRLSRAAKRRYARLRHYRPDLVVISQGYHAGGFEWARACHDAHIPYVPIVHCNSDHWWFYNLDEARFAYDHARRVFCVSEGNLRLLRLQLGRPLPQAELVRNPWNLSAAVPPPWPAEDAELHLALVGRLNPEAKGQDLALQVFSRPEWRTRPVHLHLYGAGAFEATLRGMAAMFDLGNVHFHHHVDDVAAIWAASHMLVLPSRFEGLPLALVEAMWCARPAIVTDVGGNAEVCLDGVTGFVAASPTVESVAAAFEQAWQRRSEWQQMGAAARLRIEAMMPADPVGVFCDRLQELAAPVTATATSSSRPPLP